MPKELNKIYEPGEVEDRLYAGWEEKGYFTTHPDSGKKPFTIVIPPPNVTGQLHMGHAINNTLQDVLIRYRRMQGYSALWVPGYDHAGIATQIKVEEHLRNTEGLTRHDLGREAFLERVWDWKNRYGDRIVEQLKKMGCSCDWSRSRFTMDEGCSKAVRQAFVNLYEKGYIYQGYRIINWCPQCATALSDAEVEYAEQPGRLWHIRYPVKEGGSLVVATTRPETMLGDTGIAVNPEDERYRDLVGKTAVLPLVGREIPIFADEYVDREFGTGCVKVTPCHDPNDFEMGQRHGLEQVLVIGEDAAMTEAAGRYRGLDRYEARRQIVADLEAQGLLLNTEEHLHNVGQCYRCSTTVEPMTSKQWFVHMKPLAGPAIDIVKEGDVAFVPERFTKLYLNWMDNVRDWCISRQLWWGHRIPAYYCQSCGEIVVSKDEVTTCPKCGGHDIKQDEDVLDTWFSSALWPFETLGWPDKTPDLDYYYPTSVLVTAYDIIFFWVARMIFSGLEHMGEKPFDTVLMTGLIRDEQGRKMSKSLGNGIEPIEVIEKYGADALRFTLSTGNSPGNDMRFSYDKIESARNFANKIWNATRFVLMNLGEDTELSPPDDPQLEDKWILFEYNTLVREVTDNLDRFELGIAVQKVYDFIWDNFCDWYIELIKPRLFSSNPDPATRNSACRTAVWVLSGAMKLLHPFMPFITEEVWQSLPHDGDTIMLSPWPVWDENLDYAAAAADMARVMSVVKAVRNRRAEMNVPPSRKGDLFIETELKAMFEGAEPYLKRLASAERVTVGDTFDIPGAVLLVCDGARVKLPMNQLVDFEKERARMNKEKDKLTRDLTALEGKLANPGFLQKAPPALVEQEKSRAVKLREMLDKVEEGLKTLE